MGKVTKLKIEINQPHFQRRYEIKTIWELI